MMSRENWLAGLSPQAQAAIRQCMTTIDYDAGAVIRRAGDPAIGMYQVEHGYLKLLGLNPDGRQVLILLYGPGNCFGETPVVGQRPFNHTTVALTDTRLRFLTERDFWSLYNEFREIPDTLCRKFAGNTSRMFAAREWRSTLRLRDLISSTFATLAARCGTRRGDGTIVIDLPLVQNDFAEYLEVTRQAAQREIGALKTAGLISQHRKQWLIHNPDQLSDQASPDMEMFGQ
jgi:CRP-like cAMP-binding protein